MQEDNETAEGEDVWEVYVMDSTMELARKMARESTYSVMEIVGTMGSICKKSSYQEMLKVYEKGGVGAVVQFDKELTRINWGI